MEEETKELEDLVAWFRLHQGALDTSVMGFKHFPGHGRGAVAQRNIPVSVHYYIILLTPYLAV